MNTTPYTEAEILEGMRLDPEAQWPGVEWGTPDIIGVTPEGYTIARLTSTDGQHDVLAYLRRNTVSGRWDVVPANKY